MDYVQLFDVDCSIFELFNGYDYVVIWVIFVEIVMQEFLLFFVLGGIFDWVIGGFYLNLNSCQYVNEFVGIDFDELIDILLVNIDLVILLVNLLYVENIIVECMFWVFFL